MNILKQILALKKQELEVRRFFVPEKELLKSIHFKRRCLSLCDHLLQQDHPGIIAEFKRKSPPTGTLNGKADVRTVAKGFTRHGASALAILTDKYFFGGNSADLVTARENDIPILRKDFIIDRYDVIVSKAIGADVLLLIASVLSKSEVKQFAALAKQMGMEVMLEVSDHEEISYVCRDVDMVCINNRDLKNFGVNVNRSLKLTSLIPKSKIKISDGGIDSNDKISRLTEAGYKGFFMGEKFMKENDPGKALKAFIKGMQELKTN